MARFNNKAARRTTGSSPLRTAPVRVGATHERAPGICAGRQERIVSACRGPTGRAFTLIPMIEAGQAARWDDLFTETRLRVASQEPESLSSL